jgi:CheY-like chemotaxis protein
MPSASEDVVRILFVDDDSDTIELFSSTIDKLDRPYSVDSAKDCITLFEYLEDTPLPHVIFLDINMPMDNGLQCLEQLKANELYKNIPVIMYSISSREEDIEMAYKRGAHYYIVKPHASVNLKNTLMHALEPNWQLPQSVPPRDQFVIDISYSD